MTLRPVSHKVLEVVFKQNKTDNNDMLLGYHIHFQKKYPNLFSIIFELKIRKAQEYIIETSYETLFETSEDITNDFLTSDFTKINAPAIAFPFLRSFVSFLVLTAGYPPLMLQSVNFTKFDKDKIKVLIS